MLATSIGLNAFKPGPADIGQLCMLLGTANSSVLVINRNVLLDLRVDDYPLDLVEMARSIVKYMDQYVVARVSDHVPRIEKVDLAPLHPRVNDRIRLNFSFPRAFDPKLLMLSLPFGIDLDTFDQREKGTSHIDVIVKRPGKFVLPVWLADRSTLLSSENQVKLEIRPAN
jgi:hypothetical protein